MAQVDFYDMFNKKLLDFMADLKATFPNIPEFEMYEGLTKTCIMLTKEMPLNLFRSTVQGPFAEKIDNKDEGFIMNHEFSDADQTIIKMLKMIWQDLDEKNKDSVWGHVKLLLAISRKAPQ